MHRRSRRRVARAAVVCGGGPRAVLLLALLLALFATQHACAQPGASVAAGESAYCAHVPMSSVGRVLAEQVYVMTQRVLGTPSLRNVVCVGAFDCVYLPAEHFYAFTLQAREQVPSDTGLSADAMAERLTVWPAAVYQSASDFAFQYAYYVDGQMRYSMLPLHNNTRNDPRVRCKSAPLDMWMRVWQKPLDSIDVVWLSVPGVEVQTLRSSVEALEHVRVLVVDRRAAEHFRGAVSGSGLEQALHRWGYDREGVLCQGSVGLYVRRRPAVLPRIEPVTRLSALASLAQLPPAYVSLQRYKPLVDPLGVAVTRLPRVEHAVVLSNIDNGLMVVMAQKALGFHSDFFVTQLASHTTVNVDAQVLMNGERSSRVHSILPPHVAMAPVIACIRTAQRGRTSAGAGAIVLAESRALATTYLPFLREGDAMLGMELAADDHTPVVVDPTVYATGTGGVHAVDDLSRLTVTIMSRGRPHSLRQQLAFYLQEELRDIVARVVVVANDELAVSTTLEFGERAARGGADADAGVADVRTRLLLWSTGVNSLNNRFAVRDAVDTTLVYMSDDDVHPTADGLRALLRAFRLAAEANPDAGDVAKSAEFQTEPRGPLMAAPVECARVCKRLAETEGYLYDMPERHAQQFSMSLPQAVMRRELVSMYFDDAAMPNLRRARTYVDSNTNCEDVLFAFVTQHRTGKLPVFVDTPLVWLDAVAGEAHGLSTTEGFGRRRSECLANLHAILGVWPFRPIANV